MAGGTPLGSDSGHSLNRWIARAAWMLAALTVLTVVVAVALEIDGDEAPSTGEAAAAVPCKESPGGVPRTKGAKRAKGTKRAKRVKLATLQPSASRASVLLDLGYHDTRADDIFFAVKGRRVASTKLRKGEKPGVRRARRGRAVSAMVVDWPRTSSERLGAAVRVKATPNPLGNRVAVAVCVDRDGDRWSAGQYEGSISVYGTRLEEFTYPIVITSKWPPLIPILVLVAAILAFLLMAFATNSLTFNFESKKWPASLLGLAIAVGAAGLTYWGQYGKSPTWGDDPGAQITALALAGFTAAVGGLAAGQRLLRGEERKANEAAAEQEAADVGGAGEGEAGEGT